jgi:MFS transporter, PPP family, 3-phenylpropionic acid transporter
LDDRGALGRRLSAHYALIQSIYNMGYCCIMSFASVFLLSRGFANSEVGIALMLASALAIVTQPILASFADRSKHIPLRSIVATLFGAIAVAAALLLITPAVVLPTAILYIALYCLQSVQLSLVTSLSIEHINAGVPLNFSLARGLGSFAFALLSFGMGFLVDAVGTWAIMAITIAIGLGGVALTATFRRPEMGASAGEPQRAAGLVEFGTKNKRFMAIVVSIALLFFSHILINTYTIQIVRNVGGTGADMGIATALAGFLELPAMALFPLFLRWLRSAGTIMKLSGVFIVVKALVTLLAPNVFWIDVAQCFQFFAFALFVPSSVFYVNDVIAEVDKVKGQAAMGMALGISAMVGNLAGGLILDTPGGVSQMLSVGLAVSVVGLVLVLLIDGTRTRPRGTAQPAAPQGQA